MWIYTQDFCKGTWVGCYVLFVLKNEFIQMIHLVNWYQSFFLKIYLFIICKYTVAVFRHSRRGSQISLWMVVSHHVVAGIWTPDLRKSSRVLLPTEPSHQPAEPISYFRSGIMHCLSVPCLVLVTGHTREYSQSREEHLPSERILCQMLLSG